MDNIDDYYLNPNIDGSLQDYFERMLGFNKINRPEKINVKQLTLIAILDCIDAAIDYHNKINFLLLSKMIMELKR
ncbi:MAG: hypothetical protein A4E52_00289 [Pelotomaculum sp. PtaB.Bin013]|uniref:Uncharacterized protein n=1 Tax=Pelotomaculum isophthalicicum JI TaxID=947010 RepID=A0A9X4H6A3_9FIRM|nr:hypothetical protein [Pelotomaculum isophthalicicum]MDF9408264.1 hypothetical protein [Pelotomaculum isophthalicicum JI]OPX91855.1 MAG: hypothetical protein A4E52_00289 [Pelotomaculum sp. PtaB.Bin013]